MSKAYREQTSESVKSVFADEGWRDEGWRDEELSIWSYVLSELKTNKQTDSKRSLRVSPLQSGRNYTASTALCWETNSLQLHTWWQFIIIIIITARHYCPVILPEDRAGGRESAIGLQERREPLLFEFQSPDMLRPSCPSFSLLIPRWRWGWRWGGWWWWCRCSCFRDLHLRIHIS